MVSQIWVNIGSGNGLVPDGAKPLPEPMLTSHRRCSVAFSWEHLSKNCSWICNMCLKITLLKLLRHPPRANELNWGPCVCCSNAPVVDVAIKRVLEQRGEVVPRTGLTPHDVFYRQASWHKFMEVWENILLSYGHLLDAFLNLKIYQ